LRDRIGFGAAPNGRNSARECVSPGRDPHACGASFAASSLVFVAAISRGRLLRMPENDHSFPRPHALRKSSSMRGRFG